MGLHQLSLPYFPRTDRWPISPTQHIQSKSSLQFLIWSFKPWCVSCLAWSTPTLPLPKTIAETRWRKMRRETFLHVKLAKMPIIFVMSRVYDLWDSSRKQLPPKHYLLYIYNILWEIDHCTLSPLSKNFIECQLSALILGQNFRFRLYHLLNDLEQVIQFLWGSVSNL